MKLTSQSGGRFSSLGLLVVVLTIGCTADPYINDFEQSPWVARLPAVTRQSILWFGDVEEGTLSDWTYADPKVAGGGIFNTGEREVLSRASKVVSRSGKYSAEATINGAFRAQNGKRAVRLMRWTNKAWPQGGEYFPIDAYYSTWMYFPVSYNPSKYVPSDPGGWWNVFQFKSQSSAGVSEPIWVLYVDHDAASDEMSFYLSSKYNDGRSIRQTDPLAIPAAQWVHIEARYVQAASATGSITIWQDGQKILAAKNVVTVLESPAIWGIGNYTDHITGGSIDGSATIYFDDSAVSTQPLSAHR